MFCLTTPGIRNMLLRELPMALPFPMTLLLLLTDKTLLEDVPQDTQQNHKGVQAIHGAPILREIRLMDGPLEKRLFGPLGIPQDNRLDVKLIAVKLILLALAFALSVPATGLFLYTIISIGQGVWKRLRYLSLFFLVPFAMLALIFAPAGTAYIGLIPFILFGCAVIFDIQNVYRHAKRIRDIKRKMNE